MPWRISENAEGCDGYAVVKKDGGKVVGCHPTRGKANAQLRALYANEAQTASAVGELARELLEEGGDGMVAAPLASTIARRRSFDPMEHPRHPAGVREGGRFRVKANADGRFEVVGPNGKKVAETNDEAEAQDLARNRNVVPEEGLRARFEEIERKYAAAPNQYDNTLGTRKITPLGEGRWEVSSQDGSYGRHEYPVFRGDREDVMRYVQRDITQQRETSANLKSIDAERGLPPIDTTGRASLSGQFSKIPNVWAVEQGYAVWNDPPDREPGFIGRHDIGATPSIRWRRDVNPEAVLVHYLGGNKPPENFPLGSRGWEQFMYGRTLSSGSSKEEKAALKMLRGAKKADREAIVRRITAALVACGFDLAQEELDLAGYQEEDEDEARDSLVACGLWDQPEALTAAVRIPENPPRSWFTDPGMERPTPLTVTADGRVYGHLALWDSCHIGEPGGAGVCVAPPRSGSGYTLFHLGEIETAEGELVACGKITLGTGHASLQASRGAAAAHYDNTGAVVADVRAGEDKHGIWVSGALRPGLPETKVRELRAAGISGDWRRYRDSLELVAALAVNVPGFPIPRVAALVAPEMDGDDRLSLVAAGLILEPIPMSALEVNARLDALALLAGAAMPSMVLDGDTSRLIGLD